MFTGIIQSTGKIKSAVMKGDSIVFSVKPAERFFLKDIKIGDSIAVNGACMTVVKKTTVAFYFVTINESLVKTNLSTLKVDAIINLEKAMTLADRIDGHLVQGHIDTTGVITKVNTLKNSWEFYVRFPSEFRDNIIYVGSITLNGVSLTVAEVVSQTSKNILIKVAIIPHTFENTNFNMLKENDVINIEFDMMGKYVKRIFENLHFTKSFSGDKT